MIITPPAPGFTHVVDDIDDSYYSVQQASAQEESIPPSIMLPFTPFSLQREQEAQAQQAIPEGGETLIPQPSTDGCSRIRSTTVGELSIMYGTILINVRDNVVENETDRVNITTCGVV